MLSDWNQCLRFTLVKLSLLKIGFFFERLICIIRNTCNNIEKYNNLNKPFSIVFQKTHDIFYVINEHYGF